MQTGTPIRNIFILDSKKWFLQVEETFDPKLDLVLTFDFGLKRMIENLQGRVLYVDRLCEQNEMQANNFIAAEFIKKWHYDKEGKDFFFEDGVSFGFSFRIEIWNELLYMIRIRVCLEKLRSLNYKSIFIGTEGIIEDTLIEMNLTYTKLPATRFQRLPEYYFNIHQYMFQALHQKNLRNIGHDIISKIVSYASYYFDILFGLRDKRFVFIQVYHPTKKIVEYLQQRPDLKIITPSLVGQGIRKFFFQRLIPICSSNKKIKNKAKRLFVNWQTDRTNHLVLRGGIDITDAANRIIEYKISNRLLYALRVLKSVIFYNERLPISLEVMVANLGLMQTVADCVFKSRNISRYLIINGMLTEEFLDEGKYADYINGFSESVKGNYFAGNHNVVCLGDPRMDNYVSTEKKVIINRKIPTICIGTAGFYNLDLNSYSAVEFEFISDILNEIEKLIEEGFELSLIIKVRPNGYISQYKSFVDEYFPQLKVTLVDRVSMIEVLKKTDLYISIYSQTLFEASCLGIPVIYYKNDNQILQPPFDGKSELVTCMNREELRQAILDFRNNHPRFDPFLDRKIMEKYIGPLDGKNLERNINFIYELLEKSKGNLKN